MRALAERPSPKHCPQSFEELKGQWKKGMLAARQAEWAKWKRVNATVILSAKEGNRLVSEGHQVVGTQWIDTDKTEPLRMKDFENPDIPPSGPR